MTSVQDSINALYAEAERNAKDGTPMFALLHGMPTDDAPADPKLADPALADQALADGKPTADAHAEIPIPMQPDTSAMDIADASPRQMMETAPAHTDKAVAYAEPSRAARFEALRMLAEREVDAAPAQDDIVGRTVTHHSIDSESLRGATPVTHAAEGLPAALPEQPPAPPALETDKDLDITDIHQLVQQAWEDGDAGMISPVPEKQDQKSPGDDAPAYNGQNMHDQAGDKRTGTDTDHPQNQAAADIGIAMENIAAAVKDQRPPAAAPLDVDALKGEIVQAVKSEFRQALRDDLAPVVKNVVTEVMTEIARERAAKERATKEMVARELAAKRTGGQGTGSLNTRHQKHISQCRCQKGDKIRGCKDCRYGAGQSSSEENGKVQCCQIQLPNPLHQDKSQGENTRQKNKKRSGYRVIWPVSVIPAGAKPR